MRACEGIWAKRNMERLPSSKAAAARLRLVFRVAQLRLHVRQLISGEQSAKLTRFDDRRLCRQSDEACTVVNFLRRVHAKVMREAGIQGFPFHALRHTLATDMVREGKALTTVSQLLAHDAPRSPLTLSPDLQGLANGSCLNDAGEFFSCYLTSFHPYDRSLDRQKSECWRPVGRAEQEWGWDRSRPRPRAPSPGLLCVAAVLSWERNCSQVACLRIALCADTALSCQARDIGTSIRLTCGNVSRDETLRLLPKRLVRRAIVLEALDTRDEGLAPTSS